MTQSNSHSDTTPPMAVGPSGFVSEAYNLKDDDIQAFYAKWANDYDNQMLDELKYASPRLIAEALIRHLPDIETRILDIGCGTGLTAHNLYTAGYQQLYGVDLSPQMIDVARSRGYYKDLQVGDLNAPLNYDDNDFGGAISSGTFTHGHVGPDPLHEICRILRPNGILACTVHMDLWESMGFKATFNQLVTTGVLNLLSLKLDRYFEDKKPEGWFCIYQKR